MWVSRTKVKVECLPLTLNFYFIFFFSLAESVNLELKSWPHWLVRKPPGYYHHSLPTLARSHAHFFFFLYECWDPNSSSYTCASSALLTELSLHPSTCWATSPSVNCLLKYLKTDLPHDPASCTAPLYLYKGHKVPYTSMLVGNLVTISRAKNKENRAYIQWNFSKPYKWLLHHLLQNEWNPR